MLRRKRGSASACSLTSSCRIKAEALARAFNRRIWPCTWVDRRSRTRSVTDDYDDEEYFEAHDEDGRGRDNAVARDDRTKLYGLLIQQQHQQSVDDAMDVFYDVSEHIVNQLSDCNNIGGGIVLNQPNSIRCCEPEAHGSLVIRDLNGTSDSLNVNGEIVPLEAGNAVVFNQPNSINLYETHENVSVECKGLMIGASDSLNVNREINPQKTVSAGVLNQLIPITPCESNKCNFLELRDFHCISDSLNVNGEIHPLKADNAGVVIALDQPKSTRLCESSENGPAVRSDLNSISDNLHFNGEDDPQQNNYTELDVSVGFNNKNGVRQKVKKEESVCSCYSEKCSKENRLNLSSENEQSLNSISLLDGDMDISLFQVVEGTDETLILNGVNDENYKNIPPENKEFLEVKSIECLSTCNSILEKSVQQNHLQSCALEQIVCYSTDYCDSNHSFDDEKNEKAVKYNGKPIEKESVKECKIDKDLVSETQLPFPTNCPSNRDNYNPVHTTDLIRSTEELAKPSIPLEMISIVNPQDTVESFYKKNTFFFGENDANVIDVLQGADKTLTAEESKFDETTTNTLKTKNLNYKIQECSSSQNEMAEFNSVSEICNKDEIKHVLEQEESIPFRTDQELKEAKYPHSFCEDNRNRTTEVQSAADLHNKEQKVESCLQNEMSDLSLSNKENQIQNHRPEVLIPECLNDKNESDYYKRTDDMVDIKVITDDSLEIDSESRSPTKVNDDNSRLLQVFNEARPMISRSTSLKTGKTPPGTPGRKKIVRFADVLGLDLEDVRHIISGDLPNIPSSAYSDLVLDDQPPASPECHKIELNHRQPSPWESLLGTAGPQTLYPKFEVPGQQPDFHDRVRNRGVCLESIVVSDCNIQCTCRVMNWGFNKKLTARYTTNGWCSSSDINASYVPDSTNDGMDSFAFNIFLSHQRNDLEFALCYTVNDKEHWDNNDGNNYKLSYHDNNSAISTAVPSSPTWIHQFW